ncbi:MAG: ISNCY family transposase [Acidobacteriota bacterium]|nr:ISNCY family transposase [Acidobacteriota bacterium]
MSKKELVRYQVLSGVLEGHLALRDAASSLGISARHARRLLRRLRLRGPQGLVHGNRGRAPSNRTPPELREQVLAFVEDRYKGFNDTHLTEILAEREGLSIGRETLRSILRTAGHRPKRKRRPKKHHRRRERSASKGLMVLWDGSPHRWLGEEQDPITLMAAIDDADGELVAAFFTPQETSEAYLRLLRTVLMRRGIPVSIYQDRHSALRRNDDSWSLEEQLAGRRRPTQVGQALEDLAIQPIFALSPQAKGRVERLFGVLQDRLLAEMHLDGISTLEAANRYLEELWIRRYNRRFRKDPRSPHLSYRSRQGVDLHQILAFRYQATVLNDNTVRLGGLTIDIPPGPRGRSYAKARVHVRQHLDGSWTVYYQEHTIAQAPASPLAEPMRYLKHTTGEKRTRAAREELFVYLSNPQPPGTLSLGS